MTRRKLGAMEGLPEVEHDFDEPQIIRNGTRSEERSVNGQRVDGDGRRRGWCALHGQYVVVEFDPEAGWWTPSFRTSFRGTRKPLDPKPYMREIAS